MFSFARQHEGALIRLAPADIDVLRAERFMHGIDKASGGNGRPEDGVRGAILSGDGADVRVRVDMDCCAAVAGDDEAAGVLARFHDAVDRAGIYITLGPGDQGTRAASEAIAEIHPRCALPSAEPRRVLTLATKWCFRVET